MACDIHKRHIRLPSPFWFFLATVALIVVLAALRISIPIYRKQAAIAEFKRLGGSVRTQPSGPSWLRRWVGDRRMEVFDEPVWIYLSGRDIGDRDLACLWEMPWLVELNLRGTRVTDAGLVHLSKLKQLQILSLGDTAVTDAGITHLRDLPNLNTLSLMGTNVTDAGLRSLEGRLYAENVYVDGTQVTDVGIVDLALAKPRKDELAYWTIARHVQRNDFAAAAKLAVDAMGPSRSLHPSNRLYERWTYIFSRRTDFKTISRKFCDALFNEFDDAPPETRKVIADIFNCPDIKLNISIDEFRKIVEGRPISDD
jgi:hypothetical protein